jgi:hypothetical protein
MKTAAEGVGYGVALVLVLTGLLWLLSFVPRL